MLTGHHADTAAVVADELGIDEWRVEVLPDDKLTTVRALQANGYRVAMVGDGINDAGLSTARSRRGVAITTRRLRCRRPRMWSADSKARWLGLRGARQPSGRISIRSVHDAPRRA